MSIEKEFDKGVKDVSKTVTKTANQAGNAITSTAEQAGKDAENPTDDQMALDAAEVGFEVGSEAAG
jgi:hypothetical protein